MFFIFIQIFPKFKIETLLEYDNNKKKFIENEDF